jgi:hypothetical protein
VFWINNTSITPCWGVGGKKQKDMGKLGLTLLVCLVMLSSCGITTSHVSNNVTTVTHVQLSQNNFRVIGRVSGSAKNWYILGFGGLLSRNLYGKAKDNMMRKVDLTGARAIIDVTYDTHVREIIVYGDYTVTATGTLIEFIDPGKVRQRATREVDEENETPKFRFPTY